MWTKITRAEHEHDGLRYASDMTDGEWALIEPFMPPAKALDRPRTTDLREVVNALLYLLRGGGPWRLLPKDFPPRSTVQRYFSAWREDGTWQRINHVLLPRGRGPGGQSLGRGNRQPVGENHRKRRRARLRRRQEGRGPQAAHPD